jgi:hypothetical protein
MVLCAAELPLESLCKVKDIFVVPGSLTSTKGRGGGEHFSVKKNKYIMYKVQDEDSAFFMKICSSSHIFFLI